ncbi:ATP-binding cassette domain-containing protein [Phocaeicola oris]|uniref:ATP-binding cassette domain-containing protein n=1 Tax=Phocaeicola oris TaxID=2896850 RepID=UPI00234ED143|nr:ATP-binding cassette domain-containing protein [Phocaeicola oris]MCE2615448.1 ATP-binding cassette domain-containing protein [Phocaeicola oris]
MNSIGLRQILPKVFKNRADLHSDVWNENIEFKKGETYLLEAASGTGKSSLCSYIYGYRYDYIGEITFDGRSILNLKVNDWVKIRKQHLSILFQELRLFPELTAYENIKLKNSLTHYRKEDEIKTWFELLGIADKMKTKVGQISFGQQQRVAFIRAFCQPFDFILLDEPISHLDNENARVMTQILLKEVMNTGAGLIVTSIGKHLPMVYSKTLQL